LFDCVSSTALFSGGIPTSVVCQKDGRIIAVTSVFFVLSFFSDEISNVEARRLPVRVIIYLTRP